MEEVGTNGLRQTAVRKKELRIEIAPDDTAAVRELHDLAVDDGVLNAEGVVRRLAARKDGVEDDARLRLLREQAVDNGLDAEDRVGGRFLETGNYVPQDLERALKWYRKANKLGVKWTKKKIVALRKATI